MKHEKWSFLGLCVSVVIVSQLIGCSEASLSGKNSWFSIWAQNSFPQAPQNVPPTGEGISTNNATPLDIPRSSESPQTSWVHPGRNGPLTPEEIQMAKIAWKYFENNYQEKTGLVNAVNNYPSTTMWDTASYLGGMVSAFELGIIKKHTFDMRMITLMKTLVHLDFFNKELPNKVYHTITAAKVDYTNKPGEIGYSALDLGRLLIWLKIIKERYPEHSGSIDHFVMRWNFTNILDQHGTLFGAIRSADGKHRQVQEGRLGYEEYAAKGFQLWGFGTDRASKPDPYNEIPLFGVNIPYDSRDPRELGAHNYVVSESYLLDGLEFNWDLANDRYLDQAYHSDQITADFAERIYKVQEARYQQTGIITARTEHQLNEAPYFVYDTIYTDGYPWNTITEKGKYVPKYSAVALKAALGLWALWDTPYSDLLFDSISGLYDPAKGFYEGRYENGGGIIKTFTSNNNGIMLEALLYKVQGKLLRFGKHQTTWEHAIQDEFKGKEKCFPQHQQSVTCAQGSP